MAESDPGLKFVITYGCSQLWHLVVADGIKIRRIDADKNLVADSDDGKLAVSIDAQTHVFTVSSKQPSSKQDKWVLRLAPGIEAFSSADDPLIYYLVTPTDGTIRNIVALPDGPGSTAFLMSPRPPDANEGIIKMPPTKPVPNTQPLPPKPKPK